jgi:hypothetical protein
MIDQVAEIILGVALIGFSVAVCVVACRKVDRYKPMRSIIGKFTIERPSSSHAVIGDPTESE